MGEARIMLRDAPVVGSAAEVERKLSVPELLWNDGFVRKTVIILFLAAVWEAYGLALDNPLLFPTLHDTILTLYDRVKDGTIPMRAWASLKVLFMAIQPASRSPRSSPCSRSPPASAPISLRRSRRCSIRCRRSRCCRSL
ncbi:hypothetical protein ACVWZ6_000627 [Bradyrhizobium sp. GM6.1]